MKLYSYNDICWRCQEAIHVIRPYLENKINKDFGIKAPIYFVGINNQCCWGNDYCFKDQMDCNKQELQKINDIDEWLKEGIKWQEVSSNKYVSYTFPILKNGAYKPYNETIEKEHNDLQPNIFLYVQCPDASKIKEYVDEKYFKCLLS